MRNNNINKKGATNVKSELGNKKTDVEFNSKTADVIRDESKWNAFQLMGDTNAEEMELESTSFDKKSKAEREKILDRALAFRMGRKIQMVLETKAEAVR